MLASKIVIYVYHFLPGLYHSVFVNKKEFDEVHVAKQVELCNYLLRSTRQTVNCAAQIWTDSPRLTKSFSS